MCEQQRSPVCLLIHYVNKEHQQLGVDEQIIEAVCRQQLIVSTCKPVRVGNEWLALKNNVLQCADYGKDICLLEQQQIITLYGLPHVVQDVQQQFEILNQKEATLLSVRALATRSESIRSVEAKPVMRSLTFDMDVPGFEVLISEDRDRLTDIVASKCHLEKQILHQSIRINVPKAKARKIVDTIAPTASQERVTQSENKSDSNWFLRLFQRNQRQRPEPSLSASATASAPTTASITVGASTIIVCTGDLIKQAVKCFSLIINHCSLKKLNVG